MPYGFSELDLSRGNWATRAIAHDCSERLSGWGCRLSSRQRQLTRKRLKEPLKPPTRQYERSSPSQSRGEPPAALGAINALASVLVRVFGARSAPTSGPRKARQGLNVPATTRFAGFLGAVDPVTNGADVITSSGRFRRQNR